MKVALVGNQNSGKTTLFNLLTGTNQKVGNWPGVTIERKTGFIKDTQHEIVDLPGIYSLSPYTKEEEISRNFVLNEKVDTIINIIDATSLERSLYLTTQLLELDTKVIVALNMSDILVKKGIIIDPNKLQELLNTTVVSISALKNTGIEDLINILNNNSMLENYHQKIYSEEIEKTIDELSKEIINHKRFISVKMLEEDNIVTPTLNQKEVINLLKNKYFDLEEVIANERYNFIEKIKKQVVKIDEIKESITDKLDKVFLNKWLALPIFGIIMFLIYFLAVGVVGSATVDFVDGNISLLKDFVAGLMEQINASSWLISLVTEGIIAGVGAVLNFVPQLIILFICISILETTGYMSRIAFFLDRLFRKFGLSGKSLIPFIVGSGCSVPGVMAARTVEDETERKMTIMLTPFIPCSAKLPIIALFAGYFFENNSGIISASLYFLAIVVILISALIMKKFIYKRGSSSFISELPEYKLPSGKYVFKDVLEKTLAFFKRAGTIILICSVIVWLLISFTFKFEYIEADYKQLEGYDLSEIANNYGISYDNEAPIAFEFDKDGNLLVSFGTIIDDETVEYSELYKVGITCNQLKEKLDTTDKRKDLVITREENTILFDYSLTTKNSILATIGNLFSWIFYPMLGDLNWAATVSAVQGLVAKEQVVSSMAIIAGFSEEVDSGKLIFSSNLFKSFTPLSAYAFMTFNLFSAPCFGAIGAMRRELGSTKRMFKAIIFQTCLAWLLGSLIFTTGSLLGMIF